MHQKNQQFESLGRDRNCALVAQQRVLRRIQTKQTKLVYMPYFQAHTAAWTLLWKLLGISLEIVSRFLRTFIAGLAQGSSAAGPAPVGLRRWRILEPPARLCKRQPHAANFERWRNYHETLLRFCLRCHQP